MDKNDLIEMFLVDKAQGSVDAYKRVISEFAVFIGGDEEIFKIGIEAIFAYLIYLKKKKGVKSRSDGSELFSWRTIIKNLAILRSFYSYLLNMKLIQVNHFARQEFRFKQGRVTEKRPTELIDYELVNEIIESAKGTRKQDIRNVAMLTIFFAGGMRRGELRSLRLADVKTLKDDILYLRLRDTKGGGERAQVMPSWAHDAIKKLTLQRRKEGAKATDYFLTGYSFDELPDSLPLNAKTIYKLFLHFSGKSPHSARATAITKVLQQGATTREAMHFSGHKSEQMIALYNKKVFGIHNHVGRNLSFEI